MESFEFDADFLGPEFEADFLAVSNMLLTPGLSYDDARKNAIQEIKEINEIDKLFQN